MPTAKPRYDGDGSWKHRHFNNAEWEELKQRTREKLRPYYPDKDAMTNPTFGHPADGWADYLLSESNNAVSQVLWLLLRLTNEELRAERNDTLATLKKADECLSKLSHDLDIMLGVDADVLGCRDRLRELIPRFAATAAAIGRLPRANKLSDAQHEAAVEMAVRVLRILKDVRIPPAETADADLGRASDAVQILQILGDGLGLRLAQTTWKNVIKKAKATAPDLQD